MLEQYYSYSNESFSGCDMVATILMPKPNSTEKISYVIGELQTISYSIHMDRKPVRSIGNINAKDYVMGPRTIAGSLVFAVFNKHFANKIMKDLANAVNPGYAFLIDEMPPFDVIISAANEYGLRSKLVIYGIRLVNEGQVMSINDVYTENTYQYVATDIDYLDNENQYTNSTYKNKGRYKIIENNIKSYNNVGGNELKKAKIQTSTVNVNLYYKIIQHATNYENGIVDLWIDPLINNGEIIIVGNKYNKKITLPKNMTSLNKKIRIQLKEGEYEAIWQNDHLKSNKINFKIIKNIIYIDKRLYAPIIESVGKDYIDIYSNVKDHTHVIFTEKDKNETYEAVQLSARKARLIKLKPDTIYKIATADKDNKNKSEFATVKTLSNEYDLYDNLIKYLNYNKKSLKYCLDIRDFNNYINVINKTKQLYSEKATYERITDAFIDVKNIYEKQLKNLKTENFKNEFDFNAKKEEIKKYIDITTEIIYIVSSLNNDAIYGYNYDIMVVNPPELNSKNNCTNSFFVDYSINKMDFYRLYSNTEQFKKTIEKNNFKDIGDKYLCIFNGTPKSKHYTYAVNSFGFRSPKVEFYTLDDNSKTLLLEDKKYKDDLIEYNIQKAINSYSNEIKNLLNEKEKREAALEELTMSSIKNISLPIIEKTENNSIKVKINESEDLLKENEYMIAIEDLDKVLYNNTKYKQLAKSEIEFTSLEHGLKLNKKYAIWIEDKDENQVCDSVICEMKNNDEELLQENNINKIFTIRIINDFKVELNEKNLITEKLNNIIEIVYNDINTNKTNIFEKLLYNILDNTSTLVNVFEILFVLFKIYIDYTYDINENFFKEELVLEENKIDKINKNIISYKINIDQNNTISIEKNSNNKIKFDNQFVYSLVFFSNKELTQRSGFILSNNINNRYMTYKLKVRVGDN